MEQRNGVPLGLMRVQMKYPNRVWLTNQKDS